MRRHTWDRYAIRAELNRRGYTLIGLAQAAGLEPSACRVALLRPNTAGERVIAQALQVNPEVLWPDRYRAHPTTGRISNAYRPRRTSQKRRRAADVGAAE